MFRAALPENKVIEPKKNKVDVHKVILKGNIEILNKKRK